MSTSKDNSTPESSEESAKDGAADSTQKDAETKDDAKTEGGATNKDAKTKDKASSKKRGARPQPVPGLNPSWWAPVMCTLMIVGLLWIVAFYLLSNGADDALPIPGIGYGNLAIGFGLIMGGFMMTTRWK